MCKVKKNVSLMRPIAVVPVVDGFMCGYQE